MVQVRMESFKKGGSNGDYTTGDMERVIEKDDSNSSVTTDSDLSASGSLGCHLCVRHLNSVGATQQIPRHTGCTCSRPAHLLRTTKYQIGVLCAVALDCLAVVAALLVDLRVVEVQRDSVASLVLHHLSLALLTGMAVEVMLRAGVLRTRWLRDRGELVDAAVVVVTLALTAVYARREGALKGVGLLILLRLWRVARILNGIVLSVKIQAERRLNKERRARDAVEHELAKYREYCTVQEQEIELLQGFLRKHGVQFDRIEPPAIANTINVEVEVNETGEKIPYSDCKDTSFENCS